MVICSDLTLKHIDKTLTHPLTDPYCLTATGLYDLLCDSYYACIDSIQYNVRLFRDTIIKPVYNSGA